MAPLDLAWKLRLGLYSGGKFKLPPKKFVCAVTTALFFFLPFFPIHGAPYKGIDNPCHLSGYRNKRQINFFSFLFI